jgi:exosome complex RNA-binding protein Rrp42 (RNase PH superfamily)
MPREAELSQNERTFVLEALQQNLRLDGRQFDQYRSLKLEFEDEYGDARVTLGKTMYGFLTLSRKGPFLTDPAVLSSKSPQR